MADDYKGKVGDYAAFFTIEEGSQYRVAALQVSGAQKLDLAKVIDSLQSQEGQIFSAFNVATDRETIIQQYGNNGFPDAKFDWESSPGPAPHTVDLHFTITKASTGS